MGFWGEIVEKDGVDGGGGSRYVGGGRGERGCSGRVQKGGGKGKKLTNNKKG